MGECTDGMMEGDFDGFGGSSRYQYTYAVASYSSLQLIRMNGIDDAMEGERFLNTEEELDQTLLKGKKVKRVSRNEIEIHKILRNSICTGNALIDGV